jgi:carbonic anhydrase
MEHLLIACSDGRLTATLARLLADLEIVEADRLFVPGGPLVFVRPGMERRVALACITTQIDSGGVRKVILVSHQDCRAYERALGGLGFDQQEILTRDLRRVRALIENAFPALDVSCYLIPWRENGGGAAFGDAEPVD